MKICCALQSMFEVKMAKDRAIALRLTIYLKNYQQEHKWAVMFKMEYVKQSKLGEADDSVKPFVIRCFIEFTSSCFISKRIGHATWMR